MSESMEAHLAGARARELLAHRHHVEATARFEVLTRHPSSIVRCEEGRHRCDVVGTPKPSKRGESGDFLLGSFVSEELRALIGHRPSRSQRVRRDLTLAQFRGEHHGSDDLSS